MATRSPSTAPFVPLRLLSHTIRVLALLVLSLFASAVEGQPGPSPSAQAPTSTPGRIPPGQECRSDGNCSGFGTMRRPTTITFEGWHDCGGTVGGVSFSYDGAIVTASGQGGSQCPRFVRVDPQCGESTAIPGCCILSSFNKPVILIPQRCVCLERAYYTLFLTCGRYGCEVSGPPITVDRHMNCLSATSCSDHSPELGCNKPIATN